LGGKTARNLSIFIVFLMMFMLVTWQFMFIHSVSASPVTTMYVDPASQSVSSSFSININLSDVEDFYGWEFRLNYSNSIITATSVTEGPFLKWGPDRFLWVSDNDDFIRKTFLGDPSVAGDSWDCGTSRPYGVEYVNGFIYYVDYSAKTLYNKTLTGGDGSPASWSTAGYSGAPYGLGWNGTHFLIADTGGYIYFVHPSSPTTSVKSITNADLQAGAPEGVTFDGTYIWVSDTGKDMIYKLNATTGLKRDYFPRTGDLGWDPNGITWDGTYFWICSPTNIYKYSTAGVELASFGRPGGTSNEGLSYCALTPDSPRSTFFNVKECDDTKGRVWATGTLLGDIAGVAGSGVLATIYFDIDQSGSSDLDLHQTKVEGYDFSGKNTTRITHVAYDGSVTVEGLPEFPLGAAAEIAIAAVVIYFWWRKRKTKLYKSPTHLNSSIP
jgi:hypothetical protein